MKTGETVKDKKEQSVAKVETPIKAKIESEKEYLCGIKPGIPLQHTTIGGFDFSIYTEDKEVNEVDNMMPRVYRNNGRVHKMTETTYKNLLSLIADKAWRWVSKAAGNESGYIVNIHKESFRPSPMDEPLSKYLYIHSVDELSKKYGIHWRDNVAPRSPAPTTAEVDIELPDKLPV